MPHRFLMMVFSKLNPACSLRFIFLCILITGHQIVAAQSYLSLKHYTIDKITLTSFSGYRIYAHLQIQNDTIALVVKDISGRIYKNDRLIAQGNISDMDLVNGQNTIYMQADFTASSLMAFFALFNVMIKPDFSLYTVDTDMKIIFSSGEIKSLQKRKVPIYGIMKP